MKPGFVYILQSQKSGRYYIGSTTDLQGRLKQHLRGHTQTTARMSDLTTVFSQKFDSITKARQAEIKIKSWKRKDFIEKLIEDGRMKSG